MTSHDIILLGASVRSLAHSAVRDGHRPFCIDFFADADLVEVAAHDSVRSIQMPAEAVEIVEGLDPAIPVLLTGGLETSGDLHGHLRQCRTVLNDLPEAIESVRDPSQLFPALANAGCDVLAWATTLSAADCQGTRWLKKSKTGSGGGAVDFESGCTDAPNTGTWFQAWGNGLVFSATFSCTKSAERPNVIGLALQLSGCRELNAAGFQHCGNIGPVHVSVALRQRIQEVGDVLTSEFALQGTFGVDFLYDGSSLYVLEVNPRPTASHEFFEWTKPWAAGVVSWQLNRSSGTRAAGKRAQAAESSWARLIVYAPQSVSISASTTSALMERSLQKIGPDCTMSFADIPPAGTLVSTGEPICSVYVNLSQDWRAATNDVPLPQDVWQATHVESLIDEMQELIRQLSADRHFLA